MRMGLIDNLEFEGYDVDIAVDGEEGLAKATGEKYNLILLDVMLPKISGFEICKQTRAKGIMTPIILITAKGEEIDKVLGLELGADDYVTKPFSFDELLARIRALMRRPAKVLEETHLESGKLKLDLLRRHVYVAQNKITLSQKEFKLLEFLLRHKDNPVSRTQIAEQVWDLQFDPMSNTIDVYVNFLRKKIDQVQSGCRIETVRGVGYRLVDA